MCISRELTALMKLLVNTVHACAQLWPSERGGKEDSLYVSTPAEGQTLYFQLQGEELNIKLVLLLYPGIMEKIPHSNLFKS